MRKTGVATIAVLAALILLNGCPGPIQDSSKLSTVKAESQHLMATYPIDPSEGWAEVPSSKWPPAIASLGPEIVLVGREQIHILIKPFFDGGWGYEVIRDEEDLRMPAACYQELLQGIYWHDPC